MMQQLSKLLRSAIVALLILFTFSISSNAIADACAPVKASDQCVSAPSGRLKNECLEIASYLVEFQQTVCRLSIQAPNQYPVYTALLTLANGNRGSDLLGQWTLDNVVMELDSLTEMGVGGIRVDITYPLLTPAFHDYKASIDPNYINSVDDYLSFYQNVFAAIRARGLTIHVEHDSILADFSSLNPREYFDLFRAEGAISTRERYRVERAGELHTIVTQLKPDYLTVLSEPGTQNVVFGAIHNEVLYTPQGWKDYLDYGINSLPPHNTKLGAGAGTWETQTYIDLFAPMPTLDYIDLHIYPAKSTITNFFERALTWIDLVHSYDPNKTVTIGEAWLYKMTASEAKLPNPLLYSSRDIYDYWQPLDKVFIELFDLVSRAKQIEFFTPFWTNYFFSYLNYDNVSSLSPSMQLFLSSLSANNNRRNGFMTETGALYKSIALQSNIVVVNGVTPNHGPQSGSGAIRTVTVSGENFVPGSVTSVSFGDNRAKNVKVIDANTLTTVVPAGRGVVDITVVAPNGKIAIKPNAYSYDPPPLIHSIKPNSGYESGGYTAVINGENFVLGSNDTIVMFGMVPASKIKVFNNYITAQTPVGIGLGTVDVSVTNPDLQSAIMENAYTFVPPPNVIALDPTSGPTGNQIYIYGNNFIPGSNNTAVFFGIRPSPQVDVVDENRIFATVPTGFGTVDIMVINPDLQSDRSEIKYTYSLF